MAHADVFTRLKKGQNPGKQGYELQSKEEDLEAKMSSETLETIKVLGKQVLEMHKTIEEQTKTIAALEESITTLRTKSNDNEANINLLHIDQKDMFKQMRLIKSKVESDSIVHTRINQSPVNPAPQRVDPRTLTNAEKLQAIQEHFMQQAAVQKKTADEEIHISPNPMIEESSIYDIAARESQTEKTIEEFYPQAKQSPVMANAKAADSIASAFAEQEPRAEDAPSNEGMSVLQSKMMQAENIAKDFIFGRMPKMLNLD